MSAVDFITAHLLTVTLSVVAVTVAATTWFMRRQLRKVQEAGAQVQRDARRLQSDAERLIAQSTGAPQDVMPSDDDRDVDELMDDVIRESNRKKRRIARDMAKRQRKIERELAE